jgi:hypothetical protein
MTGTALDRRSARGVREEIAADFSLNFGTGRPQAANESETPHKILHGSSHGAGGTVESRLPFPSHQT